MTPLERKFRAFHAENPHVWRLFDKFTWQLIRAGRKHFSSDAILHTIRFYTAINTTDPDFKINNDYSAYYARMWLDRYPKYPDFFETRALRPRYLVTGEDDEAA